ncbi:MAG TPA: tyrosine-type recombinase/integrase [Armatimonadota bacterium]|jgi:site-specific recombinase XerD
MDVAPLWYVPPQGSLPRPQEVRIELDTLVRYADLWFRYSQNRNHSPTTLDLKRFIVGKFLWYLRANGHASFGRFEIEDFLAYLVADHSKDGGRWGDSRLTKPDGKRTKLTYYQYLAAFFNYLVKDGYLSVSPMQGMGTPDAPVDQIKSFDPDELERLFAAAKESHHPKRDVAILSLLLDTGIRASELCGITYADLDLEHNAVTVLGKGDKRRTVYYGPTTYGALWNLIHENQRVQPSRRTYKRRGRSPEHTVQPLRESDAVFCGDRRTEGNGALTRSGLLQLMERLGTAAGVTKKRCSPHTWRHTFAVSFLRNGGNSFSLQQILGHTNLQMTRHYVNLAKADISNQQQQFSPVEAMRRGRSGR